MYLEVRLSCSYPMLQLYISGQPGFGEAAESSTHLHQSDRKGTHMIYKSVPFVYFQQILLANVRLLVFESLFSKIARCTEAKQAICGQEHMFAENPAPSYLLRWE